MHNSTFLKSASAVQSAEAQWGLEPLCTRLPDGRIRRSSTANAISRYKQNDCATWSDAVAVWSERNQAAKSNCSSSHRCHRSAHRGSTWLLLSRCKDRHFSLIFQIILELFFFPRIMLMRLIRN